MAGITRNKWTEESLALLAELYPTETNEHTADMTGMCVTAVKQMAKKLGIRKSAKKKKTERINHLNRNYHEFSVKEMAKDLGMSRSGLNRIAAALGLKRTKEEYRTLLSRIRSEQIKRERRRAIFGLEPITNIKVITNRAKIQLRCKLKAIGYIVGKEHNIMYYSDELERRDTLETNGLKLGLHFLPLPVESITII